MLIEILQNKEGLTSVEQDIADYIISNVDTVHEMTVRQMAEAAHVSPPMVSRLCKKLGAKSWSDFKVRLATECTEAYQVMLEVDSNFPVDAGDSLRKIADKIAQLNIQHIFSAKDNIDYMMIRQSANAIAGCHTIDLYGEGMSLVTGGEFAEKMLRIDYPTTMTHGYTGQYYQATASTKEHFAIVISHSGLTDSVIRIIQILHHRKVPTLLITGNPLSPMNRYATYKCFIHSTEELDMPQKMERFGVQTVIHYILDVLYAAVFSQNYHKNMELLKTKSVEEPFAYTH